MRIVANSWHSALRRHLLMKHIKGCNKLDFYFRDRSGNGDGPLLKKVIIDDEGDSKESDNSIEDSVVGLSYQVSSINNSPDCDTTLE